MATEQPLETVTHVAGPLVKVGIRSLQRCCVCGDKLYDNEDPELKRAWRECELVQVVNNFLCGTGKDFMSIKKMPKDSCIWLVEK